ncbi:lactate utilization protein C [Lysinibacillus contaminans]
MMITNRESFLATISQRLGRNAIPAEKLERKWQYSPQYEVLKDTTQDELVEILMEQCKNIHTDIAVISSEHFSETLRATIEKYGSGSIMQWADERLQTLHVSETIEQLDNTTLHTWNPAIHQDNITIVEQANIGITYSDLTLAESGTVVLLSAAHKGRTVSFLPTNSIIVIPKSTIVPRLTQAAQFLREQDHTPSCINFITGPSNSADIEMNLVVGVHGPVRVTYIVIEDI